MTTELDIPKLRARATYALKEGTCPIMDPEIILALLDRAEQADKYEAALREISACTCRCGDTMGCPVVIAREALEEPDADPS